MIYEKAMRSGPRASEESFSLMWGQSRSAKVLCLLVGLTLGLLVPPISSLERALHLILIFLSGSLGFLFGVKVELRILRRISRAVWGLSLFQAFFTLLVVTIPLTFILPIWGRTETGVDLLRISAALGIVASVTMPPAVSLLSKRTERKRAVFRVVETMALSGDVVVFVFLGFLLMLQRGEAISLVGIEIGGAGGRLLTALICGGLVGCLADFVSRRERSLQERVYLVVGVLLVGIGTAGALGVPSVFIGLIAGAWLINATSRRVAVLETMDRIRDFVEGTLLVLIGAVLPMASLLRSRDGLIALGVGVLLFALRLLGKTLGTGIGARMFVKMPKAQRKGLGGTLLPQAEIAVAVAYGQNLGDMLLFAVLLSVLLALLAAPYGWRWAFGSGKCEVRSAKCGGCP